MKKPAACFLSAVIVFVLMGVLLVGGFFVLGFIGALLADKTNYPGKAEFEVENRKLNVYDSTVAFGNTPEATAMATEYSEELKVLCDMLFTGGSKLNGASGGHYVTYCRSTPTEMVILCHVPDLRGYKDDVRDALAKIAWTAAQNVASTHKLAPNVSLVVGLRGFASYGPIWEGKVGGDATTKSDGLSDMKRLYPYFAPSTPTTAPTPEK